MPGISIGNCIPFNMGGISWSSYWTTRIPTALVLTVLSDTSIKLDWTNGADEDYDGLRIYISTDGVNFTAHDTVAANVETYTATGLTQATIYYFYVRAYKGASSSPATGTEFQLTRAKALTESGTYWYQPDDLSTVTKEEDNFVLILKEKNGSGVDLTPISDRKPLWTANGIQIRNVGGYQTVLYNSTFVHDQPFEMYLNCYMPSSGYISNRIIAKFASNLYLRQYDVLPKVNMAALSSSVFLDFPFNDYGVIYTALTGVTYQKDFFGVDDTESNANDIGPATPAHISLGGNESGFGINNMIIRDCVIRTVLSSETDRHAIRDWMMKRNAFFF